MLYELCYPWQKAIIDKFKARDSLGLFLDMGLGKTLISLAFAEQNECDKLLIVTINGKAKETEKISDSWLGWASQSNIPYKLTSKLTKKYCFDKSSADAFVINYESLFSREETNRGGVNLKESIKKFIESCGGHKVAIIIDESHKVKNLSSLQTKAIIQIKRELTRISSKTYTYLLTGTPFTTGFIDLHAQLKILGCGMTKTEFVDNFCVRGNLPGLYGWQQPIVGYKNLDNLYDLVHQYAITIKSNEVISLPQQVFIEHKLPTSNYFELLTKEYVEKKKLIDELKKRGDSDTIKRVDLTFEKTRNPYYRNLGYPDIKWSAETVGTFWLRSRQISIGFQGNGEEFKWYDRSRLDALKEFLTNHEDNYLLFYNFTPELLEIYDICDKLGYKIDIYCGEVKSLCYYEEYKSMSDEERLTNKKRIILANFASGSTGMNWQCYNKCIIFSIPLYKDYEQGIKRIHRTGQKETVFYHVFYQKNWLDIGMRKSLDKCTQYSQDMFDADLAKTSILKGEN